MILQIWFEFGSTYSYPAVMRVENLAHLHGIQLSWHPFLLGAIFKAQGWSDSPFNLYPAMGRYMWRDLERVCAEHELPLRRPAVFPRNGMLAARICAISRHEPWLATFVKAVYRANFECDQEIAHPEIIAHCLGQAGQVAAPLLEQAEGAEAKAALRSLTTEAIERGIFGAPTFAVGEELFWGNDRLESALAWCKKANGLPELLEGRRDNTRFA